MLRTPPKASNAVSDDLMLSDEEGLDVETTNLHYSNDDTSDVLLCPESMQLESFQSSQGIVDPRLAFRKKIKEKTESILKKLREGKSVTKINKDAISDLVREIQVATEIFCESSNTPVPTSNVTMEQGAISSIKEAIKEEVAKVQKTLLSSIQPRLSYAAAAKTSQAPAPQQIPTSKPALIISSKKEVFSSAETLQNWRKSVSFRDTNFSPANIHLISNNKIRVEFDNEEQRDITLRKTERSSTHVTAEISKKLKPMLIIKGVSDEISPGDLVDIIVAQNDFVKALMNDPNDLIFKFRKGNRNEHLYNAVFMVKPALWRSIIKAGKLNIDHQRVHVEEFSPLLQCYKCLQFGHTRKNCTSDNTACSHCSSLTHDYKTCPFKSDQQKLDCYNCIQFHKKRNLQNIKTNHSATSLSCPRMTYMLENIRNRIDYGYLLQQ